MRGITKLEGTAYLAALNKLRISASRWIAETDAVAINMRKAVLTGTETREEIAEKQAAQLLRNLEDTNAAMYEKAPEATLAMMRDLVILDEGEPEPSTARLVMTAQNEMNTQEISSFFYSLMIAEVKKSAI